MKTLNPLRFSEELLQQELLNEKEQLSWPLNNMRECEIGSLQWQKWFELVMRIARRCREMEEMAKNAASELED